MGGTRTQRQNMHMGSWQQFSLARVWPLGEVSGGQMTKGLRSLVEESRFSQEH